MKFLDRLEGNRHILMLYDDDKNADFIIARYFLNGLRKGHSCVFFTEADPKEIETRLSAQGLDVDRYERENRLRVLHFETSASDRYDPLAEEKAAVIEMTKGMKGPFRFVGKTVSDIESVEGLIRGMKFEKAGQEHFEELDISLLCYYDIRKLERSRREEWVRSLLENHHQVIYASDPVKAVAFETSLLEEEE